MTKSAICGKPAVLYHKRPFHIHGSTRSIMISLRDQLASYAAYHNDPRNKLTHFFGVPLVTFAIFLFLSWFRFAAAPDTIFMNGATLFYLCVLVYYLRLDAPVALLQMPFSILL